MLKKLKLKTREGNGSNEQEINTDFSKTVRVFRLLICAIEFPHTASLYQFPV